MPNLIGQSLGRYHILEQLGEGGMAAFYKTFYNWIPANPPPQNTGGRQYAGYAMTPPSVNIPIKE